MKNQNKIDYEHQYCARKYLGFFFLRFSTFTTTSHYLRETFYNSANLLLFFVDLAGISATKCQCAANCRTRPPLRWVIFMRLIAFGCLIAADALLLLRNFSLSPSRVSWRVRSTLYATHVSSLRPAILTTHAHATFIALVTQRHITHVFTRAASVARIPTASVAVDTLLRVCLCVSIGALSNARHGNFLSFKVWEVFQ